MTQRVLVLSNTKKPLMPCHPARARELLRKGKAAVFRQQPFTIILKDRSNGETQDVDLGIDPGSKTTGMAVRSKQVKGSKRYRCVFGLNLIHRGDQIKNDLQSRRAIRRARRQRNTRYRQPRFNNRTKPQGWLPPSIQHRVDTTMIWIYRLMQWMPVSQITIETTRFDTHRALHPNVSGQDYQKGPLYNRDLREYLLYRDQHQCRYCQGLSQVNILNIDHIHPRSRGGTNRVNNLAISCRLCNDQKGNQTLEEWKWLLVTSKRKIDQVRVKNINSFEKNGHRGLQDMAAMNATRYKLRDRCIDTGLPVEQSTGSITKDNRLHQGYGKDHWSDAACVGIVGQSVHINRGHQILTVRCKGHGSRQMQRMNCYGFPVSASKGPSRVFGFTTGDLVRLVTPRFTHKGNLTGIRTRGDFDIKTPQGKVTHPYHRFQKIQSFDGYDYRLGSFQRIRRLIYTSQIPHFLQRGCWLISRKMKNNYEAFVLFDEPVAV